jgi:carbon-monoxide dehydrogenase medium subunit
MYSFTYVRPSTIADAVAQLGKAGDARFLAGGQTMIPTMKQRLAKPTALIDLGALAELKGIEKNGNAIGVGAMTTHREMAASAVVKAAIPALARLADGIGDPQVRARGTIGGSVANNDPAADYPAAILALNATIVTDKRQIKADDFFKAMFLTNLGPGEMITAIGLPIPEKAGYAKFEQRASRYALVGVFVAKTASGVRVAVTGAGEAGVFRVSALERALSANFTPAAVKGIEVSAGGILSDLHAPADYRASLITVMTERAVAMALAG